MQKQSFAFNPIYQIKNKQSEKRYAKTELLYYWLYV